MIFQIIFKINKFYDLQVIEKWNIFDATFT